MTIVIMGLIIVLKDNHNPLKSYSDNNMIITMMIMFLVVTGIVEEKPDINNTEHVSVYAPNVSEQHVVQQSHERNEEEEDESPLLFIIICILMLLAILSVSSFIENYYLY